MRKIAVLLLCVLTLAGCSPQTADAPPVSPLAERSGNFQTGANISYKGIEATATISQQSPDACHVAFTAPSTIKDMTFVFRRDSVDVSYKGLAFQFDPGSLPGGAIAKTAVMAINQAIRDDDCVVSLTDAGVEVSGTSETGAFTLRLDPEAGNFLKLSIPGEELEIEFVNFAFLD